MEEVIIIENFYALFKGDYDLAYALIEKLYMRDDLPDGEELMLSIGIELNEGTVPFIRGYYGFRGQIKLADRFHRVYDAFIRKNNLFHFAFSAYQRTAMSEIYYERNDLREALHFAEMAIVTAQKNEVLGALIPAIILKSRIQWANNETEAALNTVHEAMNQLKGAVITIHNGSVYSALILFDTTWQRGRWGQRQMAGTMRFEP